MIPAKKHCPLCNHRFMVDPVYPQGTCPRCGSPYVVNPKLRDTERARGGFTIESLINESNIKEELLKFISENPYSSSHEAAKHLRKSVSTVRTYIRMLEATDVVNVDKSGKSYRYMVRA